MKTSHKWLQTYFEETIPSPDELADIFNAHAFEVEGIEKFGDDSILDVKVLPDRAHYALCHRGIAGEIQAITGRLVKTVAGFEEYVESSPLHIKIEDQKLCLRYIATEIKNVSMKESPAWLKERIESVGQRSINALVDIMNFVMLDIGQPMHVFDADKVSGNILVRLAKEGEKITTLDGKEITLSSSDLVIADDVEVLAIAGVKGGKKAEVDENTKNIIIESANFQPSAIRRTSTRLNLRTDASKRFENEITPELAVEAMQKAVSLVLEICGGEKDWFADVYPVKALKWKIEVSANFISSVIGQDISETEITEILSRLGCEVSAVDGILTVTPPLSRLDLRIPEDLADEVGRIRGYENLPDILPPDIGTTPTDKGFYYADRIKDILIKVGFSEVSTYSLVNKGDFEIRKSMAADKNFLRTGLSNNFSKAIELNLHNAPLLGLSQIKIFEIGKVFPKKGEHTSLCVGIANVRGYKGDPANEEIKKTREHLIKELGAEVLTACTIDDSGGILLLKGKPIGVINNTEGIMELDLDALVETLPEIGTSSISSLALGTDIKYKPISAYPFILRDIAVFVPGEQGREKEVLDIIKSEATDLLVRADLFDVFTKKKEGQETKTSYAFRLVFQSFERTLTDEDANNLMNAISSKMVEKNWEVR